MMNIKDVKDLIDLIEGTDVVEVEVERAGARIRVRRGVAAHGGIAPATGSAPASAAQPAATQGAPGAPAAAPAPAETPANVFVVTAPLVGRFYRSPAPDAEVYVEVGDRVRKGQVLCIIEAMKLMNQIEAEQAGVVRAILADDGTPVEFGAPLFEIEKAE